MISETHWNRRGFMTAGAALALASFAPSTVRAETRGMIPRSELKSIVDATADCQRIGEACLAKATRQLAQGDTRMSRCQQTCITMLALTRAMLTVATHATADPTLIVKLAAATAQACRECEATCREFPAEEYKRCAESCRRSAAACESLRTA